MTQYIIRRFLWTVPVLLAIMTAVFLLAHQLPGGPFDYAGEKQLPASVVKNLERKYHLDEPIYLQLGHWIWDALHFDLGPSFYSRTRTVNEIVMQTFPISAQLGVLSILIALLIGIPLGVIAAVRQNTMIDYSATFFTVIGLAIPNMVLGPFLIWTCALLLGWFPAARWGTDYSRLILGVFPPMTAKFWMHAALPAITLGTAFSARIGRLTRASLLQVIREDYITTAMSKGLSTGRVVIVHALRNSLIPVVTVLGPMFAAVVTGSLIVEQIFGIPGMGKYFITSITNRDYPVVMGATLVYAVLLVLGNLFVDISYGWLDPRIRYD